MTTNQPKNLAELLGPGYKKRCNLPPYGPPPPEGLNLLRGPQAAPEEKPAFVDCEAAIDERLAAALSGIGDDDPAVLN